jgi:hypothetical protein
MFVTLLNKINYLKHFLQLDMVTHACSPSYSGGRDQEDLSSMPAHAKSGQDPHLNKGVEHGGMCLSC